MNMLPDTNILISTIDADIANIADDQFGLVFAGGMAVMAGGVLSALVVGGILSSQNTYGKVVADSYVEGQGGNVEDIMQDEDFWNSLKPEEQEKMKELLKKIKDSKSDKAAKEETEVVSVGTATTTEAISDKEKAASIFSDYDD